MYERISVGLLAVLLAVGCGGGGGTDGGVGGGTGGSGGGGGVLLPAGVVSLSQDESPLSGAYSTSGVAAFYVELPSVILEGCTATTLDGCLLQECARDGGLPGVDAGVVKPGGTITITAPQGTLALTRESSGIYLATGSGTGTWSGGELLRAVGTGDAAGAPAFSLEVAAPTKLALSAPAAGASVSRTAPLTVRWQASATGQTDVKLSTGNLISGRATVATCSVSAASGSFTLSAAVTARLVSGPAALQLINRASERQATMGWNMEFSSSSSTTRNVSVP